MVWARNLAKKEAAVSKDELNFVIGYIQNCCFYVVNKLKASGATV